MEVVFYPLSSMRFAGSLMERQLFSFPKILMAHFLDVRQFLVRFFLAVTGLVDSGVAIVGWWNWAF